MPVARQERFCGALRKILWSAMSHCRPADPGSDRTAIVMTQTMYGSPEPPTTEIISFME